MTTVSDGDLRLLRFESDMVKVTVNFELTRDFRIHIKDHKGHMGPISNVNFVSDLISITCETLRK